MFTVKYFILDFLAFGVKGFCLSSRYASIGLSISLFSKGNQKESIVIQSGSYLAPIFILM